MKSNADQHTGFSGTYFDKNSVLRLSTALVILGWVIFAYYIVQWLYGLWQNVAAAMMGNYPLDFSFLIYNSAQPFQGALLLGILLAASKVMLILLDIEDNTRRAARNRE